VSRWFRFYDDAVNDPKVQLLDGDAFKAAISTIPGYPAGEPLPMRFMVFESNALARLGDYLTQAGATPAQPLAVVMDRTPMQRAGADLKAQVLAQLRAAGWRGWWNWSRTRPPGAH
jgi:hypothetical protein